MTTRVVVVGDLVTDVVAVLAGPLAAGSEVPAGIHVTAGGQGGNTAAWLARCGVPVTLVATVGDDPVGGELVAELTAGGVDCAVRQVAGAATGTLVVLVGRGEPTMVADRGAARQLRRPTSTRRWTGSATHGTCTCPATRCSTTAGLREPGGTRWPPPTTTA